MKMFCPECGKECKRVNEYKSLFVCETCKETYRAVRVGFTVTRWEIVE